RLFIPAYQDTSEAVHPRVGPLHHPPPGLLACFLFDCLCFLATRPNMGGEPKLLQNIAHFLIVIPFVEAHTLRLRLCWLRALDDQAVERGPHQFHVMAIGTLPHQAKGDAVALSQQTAFDPAFGAIGRVGAGFFPLPGVPWSWRRPCLASSSQCPVARQTAPPPFARVLRRPPLRPIAETGHARWTWDITRSGSRLPIGIPSGGRKKWHRHSGDQRHGD